MAARVQAPRVWVTPSTRLHTTGRARCVRGACPSRSPNQFGSLPIAEILTSELAGGTVCTAASSDLLVVGPGVLGSQVGSKWLQVRTGLRPQPALGFGWKGF
jgi:hypothetical protein